MSKWFMATFRVKIECEGEDEAGGLAESLRERLAQEADALGADTNKRFLEPTLVSVRDTKVSKEEKG